MVKIAELKNNLSRHLAHVRQGGQITVLDRETPVARIVPFLAAEPRVGEEDAAAGTAAERIAELARQGLVSPGDPRAVADSLASRPPLRVPPGAPRALDVAAGDAPREPAVKFWDTSALVPLVVDEPTTPAIRDLLSRDRDVVVWMLTGVELLSMLGRLGRIAPELRDVLPRIRLEAIDVFRRWTAVTHVEGVLRRAERLVGVHPLSAADAMQLGAALIAAGDRAETLSFVTLDRNLARAAQLEGFRVLPETR